MLVHRIFQKYSNNAVLYPNNVFLFQGARLLTHVDRQNTHAASLIVNIAQEGIKEPWMVEIYDFADRLHEIEMEEGDIVYYESAR